MRRQKRRERAEGAWTESVKIENFNATGNVPFHDNLESRSATDIRTRVIVASQNASTCYFLFVQPEAPHFLLLQQEQLHAGPIRSVARVPVSLLLNHLLVL